MGILPLDVKTTCHRKIDSFFGTVSSYRSPGPLVTCWFIFIMLMERQFVGDTEFVRQLGFENVRNLELDFARPRVGFCPKPRTGFCPTKGWVLLTPKIWQYCVCLFSAKCSSFLNGGIKFYKLKTKLISA